MNLDRFFICFLASSFTTSSALAAEFVVTNNLPGQSSCPNGNTATIFYGGAQQTITPGSSSAPIKGDFSKMPGLGIQVNNWYWIQTAAPPQKNPQNPDNSGAQFTIDSTCTVTEKSAAWYGQGIQTYLIANVSAALKNGFCVITISKNNYTNAVTPGCCAPPIFQTNVCTGPYGKTNTGQSWPPA
jgi:hypothetical protein